MMALALLLSAVGCDYFAPNATSSVAKIDKQKTMVQEAQPGGGLENLTCFKCHTMLKFSEGFPHTLHKDSGLHCTQCHVIKNHKEMSINSNTCNSCHNMGVMKMNTSSMPAKFNHSAHVSKFRCRECHKDTFPMKLNGVKISMDEMYKGKTCGKCHNGKSAFPTDNCDKCHPQG